MTSKPYLTSFISTPEWRRSKSGNRYLMVSGEPLTLFRQRSGRWAFVYDGSFEEFDCETDAVLAAEKYWRYSNVAVRP